MARRVERTRNAGTWTEAQYWGRLRSALRNTFRYWKPAAIALKRAKRGNMFICAACGAACKREGVEVDHITPCGQLTRPEHIAGFLERLTPEDPAAYQVLCKECHSVKTQMDLQYRRTRANTSD
jgi:5-methylcytosine-specific restriction endonuclease McrA